jgi:FkbM family methyltransferase
MEFPEDMAQSIHEVLRGEYETGYDGSDLSIVDIGANVGAFTLWANLRWPNSRIQAWEPHPGTFRMLLQNVSSLPNVTCHNAGVLTSDASHEPFFSTYAGDGESGFVSHLKSTFSDMRPEDTFQAQVTSPRDIPPCDVLKIDVEGAEADILQHMHLDDVSLIVVEYQNDENRRQIKERLEPQFRLEYEDEVPWLRLLARNDAYDRDLRNDHFGHLFFVSRNTNRLRKRTDWPPTAESPLDARSFGARKLLAALPSAVYRSLRRRFEE